MTKIGIYFGNLVTALAGNNPCQMQLDRVREEYEKTAARVRDLDEAVLKFNEKIASYQNLIENLRQRIAEKDNQISQMENDYQKTVEDYRKRIADYSLTIAKLQDRNRKKGQKAPKTTKQEKK